VHVGAGANLQSAVMSAPEGAGLCLKRGATYELADSLRPRPGQTLMGPAALRLANAGPNDDVVELKTGRGEGIADVTLVDLDISGAGRHGVGCWIGTRIVGGRIHDNEKDGIGCDLEGGGPVMVSGVEIDHNGGAASRSNPWYGNAGGIKWFHADGVTVADSHIHDNTGNGVWCDAQCGDVTVTGNLIVGNERKGVFYEKSGASDIRGVVYDGMLTVVGNEIRGNDREGQPQANAGVAIYAAKNAHVRDNTFGENGHAIIVRNDPDRVSDDKHGWVVENVTLAGNVLNGDEIAGCGVAGVSCSANA
jgi:hypothetical protein